MAIRCAGNYLCFRDHADEGGAAIEAHLASEVSNPPTSIFFRMVPSPSHLGLLSSMDSIVCMDEERVIARGVGGDGG